MSIIAVSFFITFWSGGNGRICPAFTEEIYTLFPHFSVLILIDFLGTLDKLVWALDKPWMRKVVDKYSVNELILG